MSSQRPTGLPAVGDRSYFRAGLESNERCIWVASEPFGVEAARAALAEVVEDLEEREANGQIEFRDFHVMDVFGNHHIALVSRDGEPDGFEKVESPVLRWTAEELSEQRETARIRDRLLGVLGHDLKNPLHVINLAAEELLATGDPAAARLSLRIKS